MRRAAMPRLSTASSPGLNNATYRDAFHLRPGVEVVSKTPDGDLVVQGDLDLSGYRYASLNPHSQLTGIAGDGSGEAGALTLRAGGDLTIYGSINDGFTSAAGDAGRQGVAAAGRRGIHRCGHHHPAHRRDPGSRHQIRQRQDVELRSAAASVEFRPRAR